MAQNKLYKGYVATKDKKCTEKFKDRNDLKTYDQVKDLPEYAGILAENTILIDIDDAAQSEVMMNIVEAMQLNCKVIDTTRGKHFLFTNTQVHSCKTHCKLAIGLTADIKVGFVASYEILKYAGEERFCEWDVEEGVEYQELPKCFMPIKHEMDFLTMDAGDGRNNALFSYILTLQSNDFSVEDVRQTINIINQYVLKEPLSQDEIDTITRDDAFKKPVFYKGSQFLFNDFAHYLKSAMHIVNINGNLHIFKDGVYSCSYRDIEAAMIKAIPTLSDAKRKEVMKYLNLICEPVEAADPDYIAFRNGILHLKHITDKNGKAQIEEELLPFSSDIVITNQIPWDYNANAYDEVADLTLDRIACNDEQIRALLEECIGYCFYRSNKFQKSFFLTGMGNNGKSTFLDELKFILGKANFSALDLKELGDRFSTEMMFGKLANIGDDIGDDFLQGTQVAIFKKIVTGNTIKAERKGMDAFNFDPYTKLLFSANNTPKMKDRTRAVIRRMIPIPFNANFQKSDADYDVDIKYKLEQPDAVEYLIMLGIQGLKRVQMQNGFTNSAKTQEALDEYEAENNPIIGFFREMEEECGKDYMFRNCVSDIYRAYQVYCSLNAIEADGNKVFGKNVARMYGVSTVLKKVLGKPVRMYVKE